MSNFDTDMSGYDGELEGWEPQDQSGGDFGPQIPDGQHQALLVDTNIRQRQSDDNWQLYLKFQNRLGTVRAWRNLDHEVGRDIALNDIQTLGFDVKQGWKAIREAVEAGQFVDLVCNIGVRTRPGDTRDFTDVFVNGSLGKVENRDIFQVDPAVAQQVASDSFVPSAQDDDLPF